MNRRQRATRAEPETSGEGRKTLEERRAEREKKMEIYKQKKKEEEIKKKAERPPWRPAGNNKGSAGTKRPQTRSMMRHHSAPRLLSGSDIQNPKRPRLMKPKISPALVPPASIHTSLTPNVKAMGFGDTEKADDPDEIEDVKDVEDYDIVEDNVFTVQQTSNDLNLKHWNDVYKRNFKKLDFIKDKLNALEKPKDEFWCCEMDRAIGEATFFLGPKSKFSQMGNMLQDPKHEKFKVKTEDDISCFWDGMVFPAVDEFLNRAHWLIDSSEKGWDEKLKQLKPLKHDVFDQKKPSPKEKKPMSAEEAEAAAKKREEQKKKKLKAAKEASERRAKMRQMMAEKKRALSAADLNVL